MTHKCAKILMTRMIGALLGPCFKTGHLEQFIVSLTFAMDFGPAVRPVAQHNFANPIAGNR